MTKPGVLALALCGALIPVLWRSTPATAGTQIAVEPYCSKGGPVLGFLALFPNDRRVVQMTCRVSTGDCQGAQLSLTDIDAGKPLRFLDLGPIVTATLSHYSNTETQISWGVNHFTVNFETGVVVYNTDTGTCRAPKAPKKPQ
ncbi:MAG TPA: hypothetical protein VFK05_36695 [Polyangiaceae bacterium]|nr:hypothetical protein [Polyangiaceae bacterium]